MNADDDDDWLDELPTETRSDDAQPADGQSLLDDVLNSVELVVDVEPAPPKLEFESVYAFVEDHLIYIYARNIEKPGRQWCRQWWAHPEAMSRFEALWRAYEHLRLDPGTGMDVWWLDHADRQMAVLLDPEGPFDGCSAELDRHEPAAELLPVQQMEDHVLRQIMAGQPTQGD